MNAPQDFRNMTADTIGKDLLQALVMELKLLPDPWPKLSKKKQDDIIDRLRNRVETNVKMAVHMLAAEGRIVVAGDLDQITIKDGVKAVIKFGAGAPNLHELYEVTGKQVLVVVANAADHTGGMNDVQGEADQRAMDLGHEYHDNDGGGMDDGEGNGEVIEGEVLGLPAPGDTTPTEEELQKTFEEGYQAAADGKTKDDAPVIRYELVEQWLRGWSEWNEQNKADDAANDSTNTDEAA
ncbi:MAG TPA: ribosome modulation factor [Lentisphaeria bacterium]|nr:ribosome modulation factor [Lentisphaeria bacterium]